MIPSVTPRGTIGSHFRYPEASNKEIIVKTLAELFEHTLKDVYYAERKILKVLPKMAAPA